MKIAKYENLHIGNFLISTGFYLRELTDSLTGVLPVSINLTQQSGKADYTIGDLFGALGGKCFIIEFKKDQKLIKDEMNKPQRKILIEKLNGEYEGLTQISIKGHLLCYPIYQPESFSYNLKPYCTAFDVPAHEEYHIIGVDNFIDRLIRSNEVGVSFNEIKSYIELLKLCASNPTFASSGALFSYSKKGGFTYVEYDNLNVLEYKIQMELQIKGEISQDNDINLGQSKGNGMGFSM